MTQAIFSGLILGMALVFSMGPIVVKTIKLRINYGHASAFYFIAGVWLSDFLWIVIANLFGSLLEELNDYKTLIGVMGGILLLALGVYYLFFKKYRSKSEIDAGIKINNATHFRLFATGFIINCLNPGIIALWLAAAAKTFIYSNNQKIVAFAIALGLSMTADVFKIELAGKIRAKLTDRNILILNRVSGILFLVFGLAFIFGAFYITENQH